jgi:membrane-bound lytic murein transglycosylase D
MTRRFLGLIVFAAVGCGTGMPASAPAPVDPASAPPSRETSGEQGVPAAPWAAVAAEDSVADLTALEALQDLEFGSLGKGAEHVRVVVPAGTIEALRTELESSAGQPRGGLASSASPAFDIDVETFADRDRVRYYTDYFQGPARERFGIWLSRLPRYEEMARERFRARGVPEDMVYLGLIESGFSNTAVSRANAVGMWQFIASTARRYGLRIDTWVDERRDPFKATDAAARHLADLYGQFGSWYLAAAAYNGGPTRITRGVRRLFGQPDTLTDAVFFDLAARRYLRLETRDYVPKLIAAAILAKDPSRYGFSNLGTMAPLAFDEITVPDQTGLDVLAGLADTTPRALTELNPQYVRGVTPPLRETIVRVPRGKGALVAQRYAELPAGERVNFLEHTIRSGETLSEIGRRYGVSVVLLRAANHNVSPTRLRIGQRLVIPVSRSARSVAEAGHAPAANPGASGARYHLVRVGETLWLVSQRYGVTISDLRRWNGIAVGEVLRIGQRLALTPPAAP